MKFSRLLEQLIEAFRCLPGVGPRTAQRLAFHLLERNRDNGLHLAATLAAAMQSIGHCERCRTFTETPCCQLCTDSARETSRLCIVESPTDMAAVEQTGIYRGLYFVLMGRLSPLDGMGPEDIGIPQLLSLLAQQPVTEVILATNPTAEGEATAHYLSTLIRPKGIQTSRIAHGVPLGSELEYTDSATLARAFSDRELL